MKATLPNPIEFRICKSSGSHPLASDIVSGFRVGQFRNVPGVRWSVPREEREGTANPKEEARFDLALPGLWGREVPAYEVILPTSSTPQGSFISRVSVISIKVEYNTSVESRSLFQ